MKLEGILKYTREQKYAVGSFSPRYTRMICPVLQAAQEMNSPVIVQISQKELNMYGITPNEFSKEYFKQKEEQRITVPVTLHLDHTRDFKVIQEAIKAGFESVMIDASEKSYEENVAITRETVKYAHNKNVSVEAELGRIGSNDRVETDSDDEFYTDPDEAAKFVEQTNVDALAVSVGTAHGVYTLKQPRVQFDIIRAIRERTSVYLVLHGGSGVPSKMVEESYLLENGGISKVNIATDLELALLESLGVEKRMDDKWAFGLSDEELKTGREAVKKVVKEKMANYLCSAEKAW